jgi:hypothetical protein
MNIEISDKKYETILNWYDGILYCSLLSIDGKDDWRLPTKDELNDIYKSKNDFVGSVYWSSTKDEYDCIFAWVQNFEYGLQEWGVMDYCGYVRPVRTNE